MVSKPFKGRRNNLPVVTNKLCSAKRLGVEVAENFFGYMV
jgi:hypothetical protein